MSTRPALDVSHLPRHGFDTRAPLWWGNLFLLMIETTMFGILVATYFYVSQNFVQWPPPRSETPILYNTNPSLLIPTINLVVMIVSCLPAYLADRSARDGNRGSTQISLLVCLIFCVATIVLRCFEFPAIRFKWYSNAYGSAVWFLLGMHFLHLLVEGTEVVFLTLWIFLRDYDMKHRLDITVLAVYWYWVTSIWIPLYAIIYFGPKII